MRDVRMLARIFDTLQGTVQNERNKHGLVIIKSKPLRTLRAFLIGGDAMVRGGKK